MSYLKSFRIVNQQDGLHEISFGLDEFDESNITIGKEDGDFCDVRLNLANVSMFDLDMMFRTIASTLYYKLEPLPGDEE